MSIEWSQTLQSYESLHLNAHDARGKQYAAMAEQFYDLATDFYEYGWGESFHFAPRRATESFAGSIRRYEHRVADALGARAGMRLLDLGCGVGGPMRTMARDYGAHVTGVNINAYQIGRGCQHNRKRGLSGLCGFVRADFVHLPIASDSYDGAYEFQATCHAPDRKAVYAEVFRVLKPGASFAGDEWCLTPRYDAANAEHRRIRRVIEIGNGLPDVETIAGVVDALRSAGFDLVEHGDLAPSGSPGTPWYAPLSAGWSPSSLPRTRLGRRLTRNALRVLETLRIAPEGCAGVAEILNRGADALVAGGECGIFTPLYFFHARKPRSPWSNQ